MRDWQPIETAPRDGREIELCGDPLRLYPYIGAFGAFPYGTDAKRWGCAGHFCYTASDGTLVRKYGVRSVDPQPDAWRPLRRT